MSRHGHRASCLFLAALLSSSCGTRGRSSEAPPPRRTGPPANLAAFEHPPLDPPLRVTATFGEYRRGHFHAGLDFSTNHQVGLPVYAPVTGYVERIRASGAGFGRSLMMRAPDGRTILVAHLDAFAEPIASYVQAAQDSTGQYEQELTPPPGALPVHAGQQVAWSGQSGAGPPHLHLETRFGNLSYNPLRNGIAMPDVFPPVIHRIILEPVDDRSYVQGSSAPRSFVRDADSVTVVGSVRAWVEAGDGVTDPWPRDAPYSAALEWNGAQVECRFERVAWNADMQAVEWVYDGMGSVSPRHPMALWIGTQFQPSVMLGARGGGIVTVSATDPPRALTITVADAAGNRTRWSLVLHPPRPGLPSVADSRRGAASRRRSMTAHFDLEPVQGPFVRVSYRGPTRPGLELGLAGDSLSVRPATFDRGMATAIVRTPPHPTAFVARGADGSREERQPVRLLELNPDSTAALRVATPEGTFHWTFPTGCVFSSTLVRVDSLAAVSSPAGLSVAGPSMALGPSGWPLRRFAKVEVTLPSPEPPHVRLYVMRGRAWLPAGTAEEEEDSTSSASSAGISGEARALTRVAPFRDLEPPRIGMARPIHMRTAAPNRWALRCSIVERGSGLDAGRTHFLVDGRQVPSEWDPERGALTWRPLQTPAAGLHGYEIVAEDRAGLVSRSGGRFLIR